MINLYSRTVNRLFCLFCFFSKSEQVERQTIVKAAKQGGRRNATEKTASDANMIVHLNNREIHQAY